MVHDIEEVKLTHPLCAPLAAAVAAARAVPPVAHGVGLVEPDLVLELVVGERVLRLLRQRVTGDRLQVRITFTWVLRQ